VQYVTVTTIYFLLEPLKASANAEPDIRESLYPE
jgi:hypothetical protein